MRMVLHACLKLQVRSPPRIGKPALPRKSNLITRILIATSVGGVAAFAGFSVYIDSLQHAATTRAVEENISSSGKQAAQSVANWRSE